MKKFEFKLASLLMIRDWNEQNARQQLGSISREISELEATINRLSELKESSFADFTASSAVSFSPADRTSLSSRIAAIEGEVQEARQSLEAAMRKRQEAIASLEKAAREKKVVGNLRDLRKQEYQAEYYKREAVEIEDIYNARRK